MDDDAPPITLLEALHAELADYERRKASAMLRDDTEYRAKILAGWDHAIGVKRAQIQREEERCSM